MPATHNPTGVCQRAVVAFQTLHIYIYIYIYIYVFIYVIYIYIYNIYNIYNIYIFIYIYIYYADHNLLGFGILAVFEFLGPTLFILNLIKLSLLLISVFVGITNLLL